MHAEHQQRLEGHINERAEPREIQFGRAIRGYLGRPKLLVVRYVLGKHTSILNKSLERR
jgi:hypothetical protein